MSTRWTPLNPLSCVFSSVALESTESESTVMELPGVGFIGDFSGVDSGKRVERCLRKGWGGAGPFSLYFFELFSENLGEQVPLRMGF